MGKGIQEKQVQNSGLDTNKTPTQDSRVHLYKQKSGGRSISLKQRKKRTVVKKWVRIQAHLDINLTSKSDMYANSEPFTLTKCKNKNYVQDSSFPFAKKGGK